MPRSANKSSTSRRLSVNRMSQIAHCVSLTSLVSGIPFGIAGLSPGLMLGDALESLHLDAHSLDAALRNASALSERWLAAPPVETRSLVRGIIEQLIIAADRIDVRLNRAKIAAALEASVRDEPDFDPIALSIEAKLRAPAIIIANGANAEVNQGLVELIKEAFAIRNRMTGRNSALSSGSPPKPSTISRRNARHPTTRIGETRRPFAPHNPAFSVSGWNRCTHWGAKARNSRDQLVRKLNIPGNNWEVCG
jgi:hypothetical protein